MLGFGAAAVLLRALLQRGNGFIFQIADEKLGHTEMLSHDSIRGNPRQRVGTGSTGMISTPSPGKMLKWGWFSNIFAASSCEAASTIT